MDEELKPVDKKEVMEERRKAVNISLSESIFNYIENLRKDLVIVYENGKEGPYPRSYLIEDVLTFVFSNEDLLNRFIDYEYSEE